MSKICSQALTRGVMRVEHSKLVKEMAYTDVRGLSTYVYYQYVANSRLHHQHCLSGSVRLDTWKASLHMNGVKDLLVFDGCVVVRHVVLVKYCDSNKQGSRSLKRTFHYRECRAADIAYKSFT